MLKKSILFIGVATGSLCLASGAPVKSGETRQWIMEYEALIKKRDDALSVYNNAVAKVIPGTQIVQILDLLSKKSQELDLGTDDKQKIAEHIQNAIKLLKTNSAKIIAEAENFKKEPMKIQEKIDKLKEEWEAAVKAAGEEIEKAQKK